MKIINPHDKFFKEIFSKKEEAQDLILHTLPKQLINKLDITSIELDKNSYVDEELKENFSDIVYSCKYKGTVDIKIAFLIEHKSYSVEYPHLQLLKYLLKIWETNIKQKQKLIPVIPIIVYHGTEKWDTKRFDEYFTGIDDNIIQFIPIFDYLFTDLSNYSDEEIIKLFRTITVQISMLLMKNIFDEEVLRKKLFNIFTEIGTIIETDKGEKFLTSILYYIFTNTEINNEEITGTINSISNKGGKIAMTTATKLRNEGKQIWMEKGMEKGIVETKKNTIIKLFAKAKFTIKQIVEYLELDRHFVENTLKEHGLI